MRSPHGIGVALERSMGSGQILHWTLCHANRRLTCVESQIASGSEYAVLYDGLPVATRVSSGDQDGAAWAEEIRNAWESAGWMSIPSR
jgi:hypothetical protein